MIPKTPSKIPGATDFAMATRAVSKKVGILWFALARIGAEVTGNALGGKFKGGGSAGRYGLEAGSSKGGRVLLPGAGPK